MEEDAKKIEKKQEGQLKNRQEHTIMNIKEASEIVKKRLAEALNKKAEATVSISREGDDWNALVEVLEEEFLPGKDLRSMSDVLAVYDVKSNSQGELISWNKKSTHKRSNS